MQDFSSFIEECERGPRLNELSDFFSATAAGQSGVPLRRPRLDRRLLPKDGTLVQFAAVHDVRQGPFDQHYLSSIPYRLEEECRIGCAVIKYARKKRTTLKLYSLGTAEGTMARTISEIGGGKIQTLSCSPNVENLRSFYAYGVPPHANFFHGPFHHLTPERIQSSEDLKKFADGFDIILEDTTFQMYSSNRHDQIRFVSQHLKKDGLFLFVEKFKHEDETEYRRRENQKDYGFKTRFFSSDDIKAKEDVVLTQMDKNEVTLREIAKTMRAFFDHCVVTWNSGNFYTLVASNSAENVDRFLAMLPAPAIPDEYVYGHIPYRLIPTLELG
ncbi:class I SAM-dependent methyltransferase [Pararhizobium sp. A13]|uniref:class I SAM-dependent methyltransferase n=1 Tax=Pararhizobium sp. A13 TaxID=3133975 RepID=UPI00311B1B19